MNFLCIFINIAMYLFLLNSNQLPAAPVMQKDKKTGNNAHSLQTIFFFSRATCNQKEFKNHAILDFKIVPSLFTLKSSSMLYTLISPGGMYQRILIPLTQQSHCLTQLLFEANKMTIHVGISDCKSYMVRGREGGNILLTKLSGP